MGGLYRSLSVSAGDFDSHSGKHQSILRGIFRGGDGAEGRRSRPIRLHPGRIQHVRRFHRSSQVSSEWIFDSCRFPL